MLDVYDDQHERIVGRVLLSDLENKDVLVLGDVTYRILQVYVRNSYVKVQNLKVN